MDKTSEPNCRPCLRFRNSVVLLLVVLHFWSEADAQTQPTAADLIELDFEELVNMDVQIQSAGKNLTRAMDLPYAAFVITSADINNSGAQSVPDALRLAPGVAVRQISAGEWAIGIRGAGGLFSRFVLVLVDGKIAYNSVFSGVSWDELNITLGDIDRIEVIRGPNAASWGANAVNGIINIITRSPANSDNQFISSWGGNDNRAGISVRKNTALQDNWHAALTGHYTQWQGLEPSAVNSREPEHKDWRATLGLAHSGINSNSRIAAATFGVRQAPEWSWIKAETLSEIVTRKTEDKKAWSLLIEHQQTFATDSSWTLRVATDRTFRRTSLYDWDSKVLQADAELVARWHSHQISTGINSRTNKSSAIMAPDFDLNFSPESREVKSLGVYLSDTMSLNEQWQVTLSARLDEHDLSKQNLQPSIRGLWKPSEQIRVWAAYSEASTTPSRALVDIHEVPYAVFDANSESPLPVLLSLSGYPAAMNDTRLKASELGYRHTFASFNFDLAVFNFEYKNEVSVELNGSPYLVLDRDYNPSHLVQKSNFVNNKEFSSRGGELSMRGQFNTKWNYQLAYSLIISKADYKDSSQSASAFSNIAISDTLNWNLVLRYRESPGETDAAFSQYADSLGKIDTYLTLDTNVAWHLSRRWTLEFIVNNIGPKHSEAVREEFGTAIMNVEPYGLLRASLKL